MIRATAWITKAGGYTRVAAQGGLDVLIYGTSKYLNFGIISGASGYGIRDNGGVMQYKNAAGVWTDFGSGGSGLGDVVGPVSSSDNAIARYDGLTGKLIQDSTWRINDNGVLDLIGNPYGANRVIRNQYLEIGNTDLNRFPYLAFNGRLADILNNITPVYSGDASASMGFLRAGAGSGDLFYLTHFHGTNNANVGLATFLQRFLLRASDGFFRLGTGSPTERLDVDGNGKFSGRVETLTGFRLNGFGLANGVESIGTLFFNAGYDNTGNEEIDMAINGVSRIRIQNNGVFNVLGGEINITNTLKLERIDVLVNALSFVPVTLNAEHGTTLNQGWWYRITAQTLTGAGITGAVLNVFYNGTSWVIRTVSEISSTLQNPRFQINGSTLEVFHNHPTLSYTVRLIIESFPKPSSATNMGPQALGADGMWTRTNNTLSYLDGDVQVVNEVYNSTTWNGNNSIPTKSAIRNKLIEIETTISQIQEDAFINALIF